jgi:hypothetical protein
MPTIHELREKGLLLYPRTKATAAASPQSPSAVQSSTPTADAKGSPVAELAAPHRTQIPGVYLSIERPPVSAFDDNPVFNESGAAKLLGVSAECMKKWRQRNQGPDYLQYGRGGPVRYEMNALMEFRAVHRVQVGSTS